MCIISIANYAIIYFLNLTLRIIDLVIDLFKFFVAPGSRDTLQNIETFSFLHFLILLRPGHEFVRWRRNYDKWMTRSMRVSCAAGLALRNARNWYVEVVWGEGRDGKSDSERKYCSPPVMMPSVKIIYSRVIIDFWNSSIRFWSLIKNISLLEGLILGQLRIKHSKI